MTRKADQPDISDAEWGIIEPLLSAPQHIGRPREVDLRQVINGVFYLLHQGCTWRAIPDDLPPWQTVYNYFRHWQRLGVWQLIHTEVRHQVRHSLGTTSNPTAGIIDSQSVKTAEKKGRFMAMMAENLSRDANVLSSLIPWDYCWKSWSQKLTVQNV